MDNGSPFFRKGGLSSRTRRATLGRIREDAVSAMFFVHISLAAMAVALLSCRDDRIDSGRVPVFLAGMFNAFCAYLYV